jgi:hypothetical protein
MKEEQRNEPGPADPPEDGAAGRSTELVVPDRRPRVAPARRWPDAVVKVRGRLLELRQHPAAMVSISAAASVGSALVTAALRRAQRQAGLSPVGRTTSVAVRGYIVHEVHVVHHIVHHVIGPPAD